MLHKAFGITDYRDFFEAMRSFSISRSPDQPDEIWYTEHNPVYTLGRNSQPEHLLRANHIPVVQTDRGGQITYHGPGQLIAYPLFDLRRRRLGVRKYVYYLEKGVINTLLAFGISPHRRENAPGVYVGNRKISSLGLRITRGFSYHGICINVDMDLTPFSNINPCGFQGLAMTQISEFYSKPDITEVTEVLKSEFIRLF